MTQTPTTLAEEIEAIVPSAQIIEATTMAISPAPQLPAVQIAGMEKLNPDDFTVPRLKLVQAQTKDDGAQDHLGQWYRRDTGTYIKNPRLLMVGVAKSRVLFEKPYTGKSDPLCRSDDSEMPRPEFRFKTLVVNGQSVDTTDLCEECLLSKWGENNERPACDLTENFAFITDDGEPVVVSFSGSAAKVATQIKNLARVATIKHDPLYIELSSRLEKGRIGNYYVPVVTKIADVPPVLAQIANQYNGINLASRAADEVQSFASDTPPPMPYDPDQGESLPF